MDRTRQDEAKAPPAGEWAVFHERPFPKRLDRAFHVAALAAVLPGLGLAVWLLPPLADAGAARLIGSAAVCLLIAGLAYGFVRAAGMIVTSLYGLTRRKQYVLDWHEPPDAKRENRRTAAFFAALVAAVALILVLHSFA